MRKICCSCLKRSDTLQYRRGFSKPAQRGEADYLSYLAQSRVLFSAPGLMHNRVVFYPVEPFWDYLPRRRIISAPCFELLENVVAEAFGGVAGLRSLMLRLAPCPPVPQDTIPPHANTTTWSSTGSYRCLNQGVGHAPCPVCAFLGLGVKVEEVCSWAVF